MFADLEISRQLVPPLSKWRVVEFERFGGNLRAIVGDFDDLPLALEIATKARWPRHRVVYNDTGVRVLGYSPASGGQPEAGGES